VQQAAVAKVLSANDYVCLLGMPGTGKTATIAFITRCLVALGKSVLITAYTHTAVDSVLLKVCCVAHRRRVVAVAKNVSLAPVFDAVQLLGTGIDIVRLGRQKCIHASLHHVCLETMTSAECVTDRICSVGLFRERVEKVCTPPRGRWLCVVP
jgi:ABC-type proline/glycine betaine transport system ATPase subunit